MMSLASGMSTCPRICCFAIPRIRYTKDPANLPCSIRTGAFPASAAFDQINSSLQSDPAERKDAVKKGDAVFSFTLKNPSGDTESWFIDLKKEGKVGKGEAPEGAKADGESFPTFLVESKASIDLLDGRLCKP